MEFCLSYPRIQSDLGLTLSSHVTSSFVLRSSHRFPSFYFLKLLFGVPRASADFVSECLAFQRTLLIKNELHSMTFAVLRASSAENEVSGASTIQDVSELADINWDNIAFSPIPTDFMYVAKSRDEVFSKGELHRFGPIQMNPFAGVLNYGQGVFEGLKAYRKLDGSILLFRPEENALRLRRGAERLCMPSPTIEHFLDAVKQTVLANKRWMPPPGKGSLYIRPLILGSGPVLSVVPAPEYTFLIVVSPVGNYFKDLVPINLIVDTEIHRAIPGGTGDIKTIGNYAQVLRTQTTAKGKGYSDVLYLDSVHKKYIEEVSSCNVFVVKGHIISTPEISGTILPGITRKSIIEVARSQGFQVEERSVAVEELFDADEVFCTGTAVVVAPVGGISYLEKRIEYDKGVSVVSRQLYSALTSLQMGLTEDKLGWTVSVAE